MIFYARTMLPTLLLIAATAHAGPMSTPSPTLQELTQQVVGQIKGYRALGTKPWDYKIAATDLPVEVGSLTKVIMQMHNERYRHGKSDAQLKAEAADELADILAMVLFITHELEIDLAQAWQAMLRSDQEKIDTRLPQ